MDAANRAEALSNYAAETAGCLRCPLAETRTQVVFGSGNPDADLMLVGEAPGFHEDQGGLPFAGQAGELLAQLLAGIDLDRHDVFLANVLKCRPPQNRDPLEAEITACEPHLFRQIELVRPRVVATLGNFATKLLSGRSHGITRVHGQEQALELGGTDILLYPLYHPAAALYTPSMLKALEDDFARLPGLLGGASPPQAPSRRLSVAPSEHRAATEDAETAADHEGDADHEGGAVAAGATQLGLF
jgi:DNA polymerase